MLSHCLGYPDGLSKRVFVQTLGAAIREARKVRGWTQKQAGEQLEISSEFLARVERGKGLPSVPTFARMVNVLNVSADELLGLAGAWANELVQQAGERDSPVMKLLISRLRGQSPLTLRLVESLIATLEGES